jgi:hypothetical protein
MTALEFRPETEVSPGLTEVATPFTVVSLTIAFFKVPMILQPPISPFASSFNTRKSKLAPKEKVSPATIYPPSEVCWMEEVPSSLAPP